MLVMFCASIRCRLSLTLVIGTALLGGSTLLQPAVSSAQTVNPPALPTPTVILSPQATSITSTTSMTATVVAPSTAVSAVSASMSPATTVQPSGIANWLPSDPDETRKIVLAAVIGAVLTAFVGLLAFFFKRIAAAISRFAQWLYARLRVERAKERSYCRKIAGNLRTVQILSMPETKHLETFFIPLRLVTWVKSDLKTDSDPPSSDPILLSEALERYDRITIVGSPGAGKTTITSHAAAALADGGLRIGDKRYFPVYIELRDLREFLESEAYASKSIIDLACENLAHHHFPDPRSFLSRKLDDAACILVLDGFDELADREGKLQQRLAGKVKDLIDSVQPGNRIVITSRSNSYEPAWFSGFNVMELTELSLEQAKLFVSGWFGPVHSSQSKALLDALDKSDRLQLLATNPLMLAIVCFVFSTKRLDEKFLPKRRVDLYERCVWALVSDWDKSRRVTRDAQFQPREIVRVLQHVAYDALRQQRIDFTRKELLALIRTHLPKTEEGRQYEDEDFLGETLQHTGLFREKGHDKVGFLHSTFQEYLAALVIKENVLKGAEIRDVRSQIGEVIVNAINPAWSEPIALAAGILRGRSELIEALFEAYRDRPSPDIEMLLAMCMRDADLENFELDDDHLLKQDQILSRLVDTALEVPV